MENVNSKAVIIRYGELYLKGKNRGHFEKLLADDIKYKLYGIPCKFNAGRGRYWISDYDLADEHKITEKLKFVFGIHSLSTAYVCASEYSEIEKLCLAAANGKRGSFRISVNRADKRFPLNSIALASKLGGAVLAAKSGELSVDLHTPDFVINVDVREEGNVFVYYDTIMGAGGMPLGCSGRGLLLLSGGLDSPVAGYMMAKRGLLLNALHFHSYPYTGERAKQKTIDLAKKLSRYVGRLPFYCVSFTKIQEAIHKYCDGDYMITIMRRIMMRIAERIARENACSCIINGESLGQVASQTMESITVTNAVVSMPVFRPLIGMDKQEIIDRARAIDTYDLSILPYEDCCTVFLPKNPVTKPHEDRVVFEESKIEGLQQLIDEAVQNKEVILIK